MTVDGYDAPVTLGGADHFRQRHPCRFHRHLAAVALRHQRAACLHHRLHGVRPRLRGGERNPQQCRLARAADRVGARRLRSSMRRSPRRCAAATSSARCCPTSCSAACARSFRIACRPRARRACGISTCAARRRRRGRQLRVHDGGHLKRRHRRAADKDGLSATAYPSGVRGTPVEIAESQTPLIFWKKELRPDSGGAGRTQGWPWPDHGNRQRHRPAVRYPGGVRPHRPSGARPRRRADGAAGYVGLKSGQKMRGKGFQQVPPGDRLVVLTPGGGGIGAPDRARAERSRAISPTNWCRATRHGICMATSRRSGGVK
jgi:hypothetical protein